MSPSQNAVRFQAVPQLEALHALDHASFVGAASGIRPESTAGRSPSASSSRDNSAAPAHGSPGRTVTSGSAKDCSAGSAARVRIAQRRAEVDIQRNGWREFVGQRGNSLPGQGSTQRPGEIVRLPIGYGKPHRARIGSPEVQVCQIAERVDAQGDIECSDVGRERKRAIGQARGESRNPDIVVFRVEPVVRGAVQQHDRVVSVSPRPARLVHPQQPLLAGTLNNATSWRCSAAVSAIIESPSAPLRIPWRAATADA